MSVGTVSKVGNGRAVFIPAGIEDAGFACGSHVDIEHVGEGLIVIRARTSANDARVAALDALESLARSHAHVPWEDDSREADRALVGERYA